MKKTKIICTMGPRTMDKIILKELIAGGMNVARFNFSHGSYEEHAERIALVRQVSEQLGIPVALMLDTKGPEIRTGLLKDGKKVSLEQGKEFTLYTEEREGDETGCSITYQQLVYDVRKGDTILIDDGLIGLEVQRVSADKIECIIKNGGELGERKGVNVPNVKIHLPGVTQKDREDILFGIEQGVDYIAASLYETVTASWISARSWKIITAEISALLPRSKMQKVWKILMRSWMRQTASWLHEGISAWRSRQTRFRISRRRSSTNATANVNRLSLQHRCWIR